MRWPVVPLKRLAALPITNGLGEAAEFEEPTWPRYIRTTDIAGPRELRSDTFRSLPPEVARRALLRKGDIVMTAAGATIGKSHLFGEAEEACYAGYLVRFRPQSTVDGRYVAYWMESRHYWAQIATGKVVSTIENFSASKYQNLRCPAPPELAQRAIADFLDLETARIDALIAQKREMVERLQERGESLIAHEVESVMAGTGRVPLKYVASIDVSNVDKKLYEGQVPVRLCNYTDVYYNRVIDRRLDFMEATADRKQLERLALKAGDVVITKDSETADDIAVPAFVREDLPRVVLGYHLALIRPTGIRGDFLYWSLRSRRARDHFFLAASGVTRVGLRQDAVGRVLVPAAPERIQAEVAGRLESSTSHIERASAAIARQVLLLGERRQALITAAVTGGLDIPGAAA